MKDEFKKNMAKKFIQIFLAESTIIQLQNEK